MRGGLHTSAPHHDQDWEAMGEAGRAEVEKK